MLGEKVFQRPEGLGGVRVGQFLDAGGVTPRPEPVQLGAFDFNQTAAEMTKLMGKGEAAARRELMELNADAVELDI